MSFFDKPHTVKNFLACLALFSVIPLVQPEAKSSPSLLPVKPSRNLFVITIDGFRWQEIFNGADEELISNEAYTPDTATMKMMYWSDDPEERRKKLMPFFWNVIASKGQLYGNRGYDNKVNVTNLYRLSYPGYNEMLTGNTDITVFSNRKTKNENINVLEWLNNREEFKGKVVAFTSWDVFPYILNEERSNMLINSGYENLENTFSEKQEMINSVQTDAIYHKDQTRYDQLTFLTAKEYINQYKPRVVFLGLGEADEFAHEGRYDLYLEQANKTDRMIAELWHWVQSTPGYKDNTTFLVTTDHGRGSKESKWTSHNALIKGASQTWLAMIGPSVEPLGEVKEEQQLYQRQMAKTIALLVGEKFEPAADAISAR